MFYVNELIGSWLVRSEAFCEMGGVSQAQYYLCSADKIEALVPEIKHRL